MDTLRAALQLIPHGVYLVGAANGRERFLYTATWLCQVSSRPPRVATAIRPEHSGYQLIQASGTLTVNCLESTQLDLAQVGFARNGDRLEGLEWHSCPVTGAPVLTGGLGYIGCRVAQLLEVGDHVLAIADVVAGRLFHGGRPMTIHDTPWTYS
jgi:flavin reductase (DIM6/NTAB) family NADH-FMN oxidoreductase RutF